MKKTRENLGFLAWHLFCQTVLEAPPVSRRSEDALRLPLTSELDALFAQVCEPDSAAYGGRAHSDGGVRSPKQKHPCWGAFL